MQAVGADGYLSYLDHLVVDPKESTNLFNTILINVTSFFRDPPTWDYLREEILPRLAADKRGGEPIRMWSAGCASGEEAYSLAMATAEVLGADTVRERVKIYGTDVDEDALNQARQARYTPRQVEGVPPELLRRYFVRDGHGHVFSKDLRRPVIFGRHDLIQDAPIPRIDLLVCRNTLMYLNSEIQSHVLARFSFALRDRLMVLTDAGRAIGNPGPREDRVRNAALEAGPEAQIVVDTGGYLAVANAGARELFSLKAEDVNRPFQDLEVSYRPLELRSKIQQVYVERRPSQVYEVEWPTATGEIAHLEVRIAPLVDESQVLLGVSVGFSDVTRSRRYKEELEHATRGWRTPTPSSSRPTKSSRR